MAGRGAEEEQRESARAHSSPSVDTIVDIFLMFSLIIIFRNPLALRDDTERFEMMVQSDYHFSSHELSGIIIYGQTIFINFVFFSIHTDRCYVKDTRPYEVVWFLFEGQQEVRISLLGEETR